MSDHGKASVSRQFVFALLVLLNCWVWMQGIHEFGHVLGALVSGGHVTCVVWHLTAISRTDVSPNPYPLLVCWSGPAFGSLLPLLICILLEPFTFCSGRFWLVGTGPRRSKHVLRGHKSAKLAVRRLLKRRPKILAVPDNSAKSSPLRSNVYPLLIFFAGFCLIANGAYVAIGSIERVGDAGVLLQLGSPMWLLWSIGLVTIAIGLRIWHQLGSPGHIRTMVVTIRSIVIQTIFLVATFVLQTLVFTCQ